MPLKKQIKTISLPRQRRELTLTPGSINEDNRTVEVVWTTDAPCRRWDCNLGEYWEVLEMTPDAVDMTRLLNGAPVLDSHDSWSTDAVIGVTVTARLEGGQGYATLRFAKNDERADKIWNKVQQGILRGISIGYDILEVEITDSADERLSTVKATRWEPYEISVVAVQADAAASISNNDAGKHTTACVVKHCVDTVKRKPRQTKCKEHKKMKNRFKREIEDISPAQAAEVAEVVDEEASQIETAAEEAVTALNGLDVEIPAEVTAVVEALAETMESIITQTEEQITEILDDEGTDPAAPADETRSAQILEYCELAGVSAREARKYVNSGRPAQDVAKDLLRGRAAKYNATATRGTNSATARPAKGFSDFLREKTAKK